MYNLKIIKLWWIQSTLEPEIDQSPNGSLMARVQRTIQRSTQ